MSFCDYAVVPPPHHLPPLCQLQSSPLPSVHCLMLSALSHMHRSHLFFLPTSRANIGRPLGSRYFLSNGSRFASRPLGSQTLGLAMKRTLARKRLLHCENVVVLRTNNMDQRERRDLFLDEGMLRFSKLYAMSGSGREDDTQQRNPDTPQNSQ